MIDDTTPDNVVNLRAPADKSTLLVDPILDPPEIGKIVAAVESLHQRVHVLERALTGLAMFATEKQRQAAIQLVDQASASYKPMIATWPELEGVVRPQMAEVVKIYKDLFST